VDGIVERNRFGKERRETEYLSSEERAMVSCRTFYSSIGHGLNCASPADAFWTELWDDDNYWNRIAGIGS
jgi:hypothetical protein